MAENSFAEMAQRLTPEALDLLQQMAVAHIESTGDRLFLRADDMDGTSLTFVGAGSTRRHINGFDGGAIDDLASWGFLHVGYSQRGTPNYRVTGDAQRFYRWLMESHGSPIEQVESQVRQLTDSAQFAEAYPGAAHHLREAFELLWRGRTDEQVVSEIGDHLRKALMDATSAVVGQDIGGTQEKPIERLRAHLVTLRLPDREAAVVTQVVELAHAVLRLDHRLNHIRDETDHGQPAARWEEVRRAAFVTSFACYELHRLRQH